MVVHSARRASWSVSLHTLCIVRINLLRRLNQTPPPNPGVGGDVRAPGLPETHTW